MIEVKLWYYPRVLENPDPLESEGETKIDYNQLIKSSIYFDNKATVEDIEHHVHLIRNTGVISLDRFFIEE